MVQVDIPAAFTMGQIYAFILKNTLKKEPSLTGNRFLLYVNWYTALILAPTGMFFLAGWPAWEGMYRWAWIETPQFHPWVALFYIFFMVIMIVLGNAGFIFTHRLVRADKDSLAKTIMIISIIGTLSFFLIDIKSPFYMGTYAEYHSGTAPYSFKTSFVFSWLFIMLYWSIGSVLTGIKFYMLDKFQQHQLPRING